MLNQQDIERRILQAAKKFADRGVNELIDQGHVATKNLIYSISAEVDASNLDRVRLMVEALDYGVDVDQGKTALEVRQLGQQHVRNLLDWIAVIKPNLPPKEKISFANRAAAAHRKQGIPTKASKRFSKNGRRTGWITQAYDTKEAQEQLEDDLRLLDFLGDSFQEAIEKAARQ